MDNLSDFQPGQWWTVELEKMAVEAQNKGNLDGVRAVAVVRNLLKTTAHFDSQRLSVYEVTRLRGLCSDLGLAQAVPHDDAEFSGALFAVLGAVRREVRALRGLGEEEQPWMG